MKKPGHPRYDGVSGGFAAVAVLLIPTMLSGCIDSTVDSTQDGWMLHAGAVYSVQGSPSSKLDEVWNFSVSQDSDGTLILRAESSSRIAVLDGRTGAIDHEIYNVSNYTTANSFYWPINQNRMIPAAHLVAGISPADPIRLQPLSLAYFGASLMDGKQQWAGFDARVEESETDWVLNATVPCIGSCALVNGRPLDSVAVSAKGALGFIWPTFIEYRAGTTESNNVSTITLRLIETKGISKEIQPELEDPTRWLLNGQASYCGLTICQGNGDLPTRFRIDNVMQGIQASPTYVEWNQTHDALFALRVHLGFEGNTSGAKHVSHFAAIMGASGESHVFTARSVDSDISPQPMAVTGTAGFSQDLARYPTNPLNGSWHSLSDVVAQFEIDGFILSGVESVHILVGDSITNPSEHLRIIAVFTIESDAATTSHYYSMATGQRYREETVGS